MTRYTGGSDSANTTSTFDRIPSTKSWTRILWKLDKIASYHAGWDGDGADPINPRLVSSVRVLLQQLRNQDFQSPDELSALSEGVIVLGWRSGPDYLEWEVSAPYKARAMFMSVGFPPQFENHSWSPIHAPHSSSVVEECMAA